MRLAIGLIASGEVITRIVGFRPAGLVSSRRRS
jgi:hypothetical protein